MPSFQSIFTKIQNPSTQRAWITCYARWNAPSCLYKKHVVIILSQQMVIWSQIVISLWQKNRKFGLNLFLSKYALVYTFFASWITNEVRNSTSLLFFLGLMLSK